MNNVFVEVNAEELLSHNKEYEKTLYEIKEENPGIKKSNFGGGWHSEDITNLESFTSLKLYIECIVERKKILDILNFILCGVILILLEHGMKIIIIRV